MLHSRTMQLEVIRIHARNYVVRYNANTVVNERDQHFAHVTVGGILFYVFHPAKSRVFYGALKYQKNHFLVRWKNTSLNTTNSRVL